MARFDWRKFGHLAVDSPPPSLAIPEGAGLNESFTLHGSLRLRLLGPILTAALVATLLVAAGSYTLGWRWAKSNADARFQAIRSTLAQASFPLNATVLEMIAGMTQSQLRTQSDSGEVIDATIGAPQNSQDAEDRFLSYAFLLPRENVNRSSAAVVQVYFDAAEIRAASRNAALLPLATGLSTIALLTTVTLLITGRFVQRLLGLQSKVQSIARTKLASGYWTAYSKDPALPREGPKQPSKPTAQHRQHAFFKAPDELAQLETAVDAISSQLDQLWTQLKRQQSEKLLYQLASGMAHQLRNSLTGARIAIELHSNECPANDREGLNIAIVQLEQMEAYVRRLLLVGKSQPAQDARMDLLSCISAVRSGLDTIAKHRNIDLVWELPQEELSRWSVRDGRILSESLSNLILNAIEAGTQVYVKATREREQIQFLVMDNGPGISPELQGELFEPFVTSKPEGLGLGLSLVRRAADYLGGEVWWNRDNEMTEFTLVFPVQEHARE